MLQVYATSRQQIEARGAWTSVVEDVKAGERGVHVAVKVGRTAEQR